MTNVFPLNHGEPTNSNGANSQSIDPVNNLMSSAQGIRVVAEQLEASDMYGPAYLLTLLADCIMTSAERIDNEDWQPARRCQNA